MSAATPGRRRWESGRDVQLLLAVFVVVAALYLARNLFEPIAFAMFGIALVWPSVARR